MRKPTTKDIEKFLMNNIEKYIASHGSMGEDYSEDGEMNQCLLCWKPCYGTYCKECRKRVNRMIKNMMRNYRKVFPDKKNN